LSDLLQIHAFKVKNIDKQAVLLFLLSEIIGEEKTEQSIIFGATKYDVEYLHELLKYAGFKSTFVFGSMDQRSREQNLGLFKAKKVQHLIVTDLAARGLDIPFLVRVLLTSE
jgi:ATP-dependent RNA helicase DDX54/DBP10